jgi:ketosteroid isomerase-like protein
LKYSGFATSPTPAHIAGEKGPQVAQEATRVALDDMLDAFKQGDNERLAARYHDDIDWLFHAPVSLFPFAGARRGKVEVFKGYALMYQAFRVTSYSVDVKMVDGDCAATMSNATMQQLSTGRIIRSRVASFHRFQDGRLIHYRGFTDSFDSVEQTLGRELAL